MYDRKLKYLSEIMLLMVVVMLIGCEEPQVTSGNSLKTADYNAIRSPGKSEGSRTFLFIVDTSQSMEKGNHLRQAGEEVRETIENWIKKGLIKDGDRIEVRRFDTEVYRVISQPYVTKRKNGITTLVREELRKLKPKGKTDIGKAALAALNELKGQENTYIIILTDGEDTITGKTLEEILKVFDEYYRKKKHGFFYISLGVKPHPSVEEMVGKIKGSVYETGPAVSEKLEKILEEIEEEIEEEIKVKTEFFLSAKELDFGQNETETDLKSKPLVLTTNSKKAILVSVEKQDLINIKIRRRREISARNLEMPSTLNASSNDPNQFAVKLKIPRDTVAGLYEGEVILRCSETDPNQQNLRIKVSVLPWIEVEPLKSKPVDFGEVIAGGRSKERFFTLTSNFAEATRVTLDVGDLVSKEGQKIPKNNVVLPLELKASYIESPKFTISMNIPQNATKGVYEGQINFTGEGASTKLSVKVQVPGWLTVEPKQIDFAEIDCGKYSESKKITLSTNVPHLSNVSVRKSQFKHAKGYELPKENILILPESISASSTHLSSCTMQVKVPEDAIAGEYTGGVTFSINGASTALLAKLSVSSWLKIGDNPADLGEVREGKETGEKSFTLTGNLPELTTVTLNKYDLTDNKGHIISKDNLIISPTTFQVSATSPQQFTVKVKVPIGSVEGNYEGKILLLIGSKQRQSLPVKVKVLPIPIVTLLPISPDNPIRHQGLKVTAELNPPALEIPTISVQTTYPDNSQHLLTLNQKLKGIYSNDEEFKPAKTGEYTFKIELSNDYQVGDGAKKIKVIPPPIIVSPKSAKFGSLRKGDKKTISLVLSAESEKIFNDETLQIKIADISKTDIRDDIKFLFDGKEPPIEITLSPSNLRVPFEVTAEPVEQLRWRRYTTKIQMDGVNRPTMVIPTIIRGPFPWKIVLNVMLVIILIPVLIILFILGRKGLKIVTGTLRHIPHKGEVIPVKFEEDNDVIRIGRDRKNNRGKNNILLWDESVSLTHAEIKKEDNTIFIQRIEGGLYINDEFVEESATIKNKDKITGIGDFEFEVVVYDDSTIKLDVTKSPIE